MKETAVAAAPSPRLSDVPNDILIELLERVSTPTAISSVFISKDWGNLWREIKIFDFDFGEFQRRFREKFSSEGFIRFVTVALANLPRHNKIKSFSLTFMKKNGDFEERIAKFVEHAIHGNRAEEVNLSFVGDWYEVSSFSFNFARIVGSRVRVLSLRGCNFKTPNMGLTSIRELNLEDFHCYRSGLDSILGCCNSLESLSLKNGPFYHEELRIVSPTVKILKLTNTTHVGLQISAPALQTLELELGECILSEESSFQNLSHFQYGTSYSKCGMVTLDRVLRRSPKLRSLVLIRTDRSLRRSPKLRSLVLIRTDRSVDHTEASREFNFNTPELRLVTLKNFKASKEELYIVDHLKNGAVMEEISIELGGRAATWWKKG